MVMMTYCDPNYCLVAKSCPALLRPYGLQPTRFLCPWDFPGKNTGVGCHFLLQGIDPGIEPRSLLWLLHCRQILYHLATRETSDLIMRSKGYGLQAQARTRLPGLRSQSITTGEMPGANLSLSPRLWIKQAHPCRGFVRINCANAWKVPTMYQDLS